MSVQWKHVISSSPPAGGQVSWDTLKGQVRGLHKEKSKTSTGRDYLAPQGFYCYSYTIKTNPITVPTSMQGGGIKYEDEA